MNRKDARSVHYRMSPDNAACLQRAGLQVCTLANNHIMDWGTEGLLDTLAALERLSIAAVGAGCNASEARRPAIVAPPLGRVLVFGCCLADSGARPQWRAEAEQPGVYLLPDLSRRTAHEIRDLVATWRKPGDLVVVSIHWGPNWGYEVEEDQRSFARFLVDNGGVSVVHGHSSHHVKGIEVHHGHPILYGCGDLLSDYEGIQGHEQYRPDLGLMYFPSFDPATGRLTRFELTPTRARGLRVQRADEDGVRWLSTVLSREGAALGTALETRAEGRLELRWAEP